MIAALKPYPAIKNSGIEWIGEVPKEWDVLRGRQLFEIKKRISGELGHPVISVTQDGLRVKDIETGEGQLSQDYSKYQTVKVGEFAMNSMDLLTGGVGIATIPGVTSPDYRVFAIRDKSRCINRYMLYVLQLLYQNRGFYAWGQGSAQLGRWRLPRKRFNDFPFPVPSLPEQTAIVNYLDHVDRRVRRLVQAKWKLLALLTEQRKIITQKAIQSQHTSSHRLEVVADLINRPIIRDNDSTYTPIGLYNRGRGIFIKESRKGNELGDSEFFWVKEGDFVISGQFAWEGAVALATNVESDCIASHRYPILRGKPDVVDSGFLLAFFQTDWGQLLLNYHSRGAAGRNRPLNIRTLLKEKISLPSHQIQQRIAEMVRRESLVRDRVKRWNKLLKEYRTRLIADIATGKYDVREVEALMPEFDSLDIKSELDDIQEAGIDGDLNEPNAFTEEN